MAVILDNRYRLLTEIKLTQTSHVWRAEDFKNNGSDNIVAVKILRNIESTQLGIKELFRRECESLTRLHHSNIITYIDAGIQAENNGFYIVTEYFNSKSLNDFIKDKKLTETEILKIILGILNGVAHAHEKNIIHRDLKPSNILVDESYNIKIIDFGISKIIGFAYASKDTVRDHMTAAYASPEQLLRNEVKPSSDLYSIGAILFYLIKGEDPPEDKSLVLSEVEKLQCSDDLRQLARYLLQDNPIQRPTNIYQLIREVNAFSKTIAGRGLYHLLLDSNTVKDLYSLGMTSYCSYEHGKKFIEKDTVTSKIYKRKNTYYLIGTKVKYHCKLTSEKNCLRVFRLHNIDDYTEWEKETKHAVNIDASWHVLQDCSYLPEDILLQDLLGRVEADEKRREVQLIREELQNRLLKKWEKVIDEEVFAIERKKTLCRYFDYVLTDNQDQLAVSIENGKWAFEQGDYIQMDTTSEKQISVGTVSEIEENKILINLNWDTDMRYIAKRGSLGIDVKQTETNLKRLRRAVKAIRAKTSVNALLPDIISDPQIVKMYNVVPIFSYKQKIDPASERAVQKALATKDIFLIQGPPGTGKTTVITEIVCQILTSDPTAKILLSSQSHVAVDHALKNIADLLPKYKIIRIGRADKISEDAVALMMPNQIRKWVEEVKNKSRRDLIEYLLSKFNLKKDADKQIELLLSETELFNTELPGPLGISIDGRDNEISQIITLTRQWYRKLGKSDEFDEIFAQKSSIVAATCLGIASRHALNNMVFDWVIVDEAGRATPPELLVPIVRGRKIILVGDHKQLPPVVKSEISKETLELMGIRSTDLEKSLFEDLMEKIPDEAKMILSSQFRMHPAIANLIAEVFYPNDIITTNIKAEERKHSLPWWPSTVVWFDTQTLANCEEQELGSSKRNHAEAEVVFKILQDIEKHYVNAKKIRVGVISGYEAQKALLTNLVAPNNNDRWKNIKIVIDNVDAFQGSETDIVIYSVVRCNKQNSIGFLNDARRLNVALSRGRTALIIVGHAKFAERVQVQFGNPFRNVLTYIKRHSADCIIKDAKTYFSIGGNS